MTLSAAHRAALVLIVALAWIAVAQAQDIKVTLLGTGCPPPVMNRQDVDGVFLTHPHSDHVVGFPDLWLTGWLFGPRRNRSLDV
jgi:ribonuclease Z